MNRFATLILVGVVLGGRLADQVAAAATLAEWNFTGQNTGPVTMNATLVDPGITAPVTLTRGAGAAASIASNSFRTTGFSNNGISTSNTDYFQFTLSAAAGQTVSVSSLSASLAGTSSFSAAPGTTNQFAYSTDGINFTLIGSPSVLVGSGPIGPVDTSAITALQAVPSSTTLSFRFYASGQTTTGGWGFNSPTSSTAGLSVLGTTQPASGSSVFYWTANGSSLGGSGSWNTASATWSPSDQSIAPQAWDQTKQASLGGTGGVVTVDAVSADLGISFTANGYSLTGGTITLSGASSNPINVASGASAAISSTLAGSTGILKQGLGTLVLTGVNSFTGNVAVSSGILEVGADAALGASSNDLVLNGTLATAASLALDAGRDLSGGGSLDITLGTTLTVNGGFAMSATTLVDAGTLSLQGSSRNVGTLTLAAPGTIVAAGSLTAASVTATGLSGGTATVTPDIAFSSTGTKTVNVPAGSLVLQGDLLSFASSATTYLVKTGGGTLALQGALLAGTSAASGGLQLGFSGSSPTDGGTVILSDKGGAGDGASQLRINAGTLLTDAVGGLTGANSIAAGLNVAGRANGLAVIGGSEPMTFSGQSSFFRGTGTSGELRLDVNNTTTLSGGFAATSGGGTATGITIGGAGTLVLGGDASLLTETITTQNTLRLTLGSTAVLGGGVTVGPTNVLTGSGRIAGVLAGAGSVQPGASPGILTAGQVSPGAGTSFVLEYTGGLPDYSAPTASVNDVVRVTAATPFVSSMTSGNTLDLYLGVTTLAGGSTFEGGFFTDTATDFSPLIANATVRYFVLGNGAGSDATLGGQGYYSFANWKASSGADPALSLAIGTVPRTATFAGSATPVNGQAMVVSAVPEPGTLAFAGIGLALAGGLLRRRFRPV